MINNKSNREISSVGSERLPYKQEAKVHGGSNPSSPTNKNENEKR
jgi:hypothetical protein